MTDELEKVDSSMMTSCERAVWTTRHRIRGIVNGENYQIGFLDIADTPYQETVDKCREVGYQMYRLRLEASPEQK